MNSRDSRVEESLLVLWDFLHKNYPLYIQSYKAFISDTLYSDGNYVIQHNGKISFFMNYLSDGFHNLVVNLMVGNCKEAVIYTISLSIYTILNYGHDGVVFHVKTDNSNMLRLVRHAEIPEQKALRPGLRSFKCSSAHLIKRFGNYYHRFLLTASSLNIEFFRHIQGSFYISRGWKDITERFFISGLNGNRIVYLKKRHISLYGTPALLPHLFDSGQSDGISPALRTYLSKNNCNTYSNTSKSEYCPIDAIILPTSGCNLGCKYCYSEASPKKSSVLRLDKGEKGIDYIFENAKKRNSPKVYFSFLGGGEPLVVADLDCSLAEYIRNREEKEKIQAHISICTNGTILNDSVCRLLNQSNHIQFSFDGISYVQDLHRPFANGEPTFQIVVSNIRRIQNLFPHLTISVRATVSNKSVDKMPEFVSYLSEIGVKNVAFEPLIVTGRALSNTDFYMPDLSLFVKYFIEAQKRGAEKNVDVSCSASSAYRKISFCGATYNNFVITPDGLISTCVEVSSLDDPLSKKFIIGSIDDNVSINDTILHSIRSFDEASRIECESCIAEKSCRGNCPVRTMRLGKEDYYVNELCIMQTGLLISKVLNLHLIKDELPES